MYSNIYGKENIIYPTYTHRWTWLQEMITRLQPALNTDTRLKTWGVTFSTIPYPYYGVCN